MNIQGLQKLTLLDYPGKTACTIFTGGCNLRCPFCHNAVLVLCPDAEEGYKEEEIIEETPAEPEDTELSLLKEIRDSLKK